jgi:hypothetical protein
MNISEENRKEITSRRARELDELRSKGVAKERRNKLKDCESVALVFEIGVLPAAVRF